MKKVAIMQPMYFPWLGYFSMMEQVDTFVYLDSVQFYRRSWQQRNRIKTAQDVQMLTVPVLKKGLRDQFIKDVMIDPESDFLKNHTRAIQLAYKNARHFDTYAQEIFSILEQKHERLSDLTILLAEKIREILGIQCECLRSSEMETEGAKDELLANIAQQLSAEAYISPVGSKVYLDESTAFSRRNIKVFYNNFTHPEYQQLYGPFISHLAVIDLIFNEGPNSKTVISKGIQNLLQYDKKVVLS